MSDEKRLSEIGVGEVCRICKINTEERAGRRLADLGAVRGARVSCVGRSPLGDPRAYLLFGSIFAVTKGCMSVKVCFYHSVIFSCLTFLSIT